MFTFRPAKGICISELTAPVNPVSPCLAVTIRVCARLRVVSPVRQLTIGVPTLVFPPVPDPESPPKPLTKSCLQISDGDKSKDAMFHLHAGQKCSKISYSPMIGISVAPSGEYYRDQR